MHSRKLYKTVLFGIACFGFQALALAQNHQYVLNWTATVYTENAAGRVIASRFTSKDIIRIIANNNGITDLHSLAFVYRADRRDTAVVRISDGSMVSDWQQIQYTYTDVTTSNGFYTIKQAFLNDEYHGSPLGSLFGIENWKRNANGVTTSYSFKGNFNYSLPENGAVYYGTFSTGRRIIDVTEP